MEFYDYDPETGEVATEAVKLRVKEGFKNLILRLQQPQNEKHEALEHQRAEDAKRHADWLAEREGFVIPDGCSIPVSPTLLAITKKPGG